MKIKITVLDGKRELFSKEYDKSNSTEEQLMFLADSSDGELFYFLLKEMDVTLLNGCGCISFKKEVTFDEPVHTIVCNVNARG